MSTLRPLPAECYALPLGGGGGDRLTLAGRGGGRHSALTQPQVQGQAGPGA